MHKLNRPQAPSCLSKFKHGRDNWEDVSTDDKIEIWTKLTKMQGERCAYCESKLGTKHSRKHIEHFQQKGAYIQCTFQWSNLFGSCNYNDSCGKNKDNYSSKSYVHADLIKPDVDDPEYFFNFVPDGTIAIRSNLTETEKLRAQTTLNVFNLDAQHGRLRQMRQLAIKGYLQTAEELTEVYKELGEKDYSIFLAEELNQIKGLPFETGIKQALMISKY